MTSTWGWLSCARRSGCPWPKVCGAPCVSIRKSKASMSILKAYKFRIYLTEEQQVELAKQFGCARFVYNATLDLRKEAYFASGLTLGYEATTNALAAFKDNPDLAWLKEADSQVLQQSLKDLDKAYVRFFDMAKQGTLPKS